MAYSACVIVEFLRKAWDACAFEVEVELDEERFCKRIFAAEGLHGLEQELERRIHLLVFWSRFKVLDEDAGGHIDAEGYERIHLFLLAMGLEEKRRKRTVARSRWLIILIKEAISAAAVTHRILLSLLTLTGKWYLSALKIAAWWRQMTDVWMFIFMNTAFGSDNPLGNLR